MHASLTITQQEAADILGIAPRTFRDWVAKGYMPARLPGRNRWSRQAIEAAVANPTAVIETASPKSTDSIMERIQRLEHERKTSRSLPRT